MGELQVLFHSPREVSKFVQLAAAISGELFVVQDNHTVSGKDLLGMFSLDLRRALRLDCGGCQEAMETLRTTLSEFLA